MKQVLIVKYLIAPTYHVQYLLVKYKLVLLLQSGMWNVNLCYHNESFCSSLRELSKNFKKQIACRERSLVRDELPDRGNVWRNILLERISFIDQKYHMFFWEIGASFLSALYFSSIGYYMYYILACESHRNKLGLSCAKLRTA